MRIEWAYIEGKRLRIELRVALLMKSNENLPKKKKTVRACCTAKSCNHDFGEPGLAALSDAHQWILCQ